MYTAENSQLGAKQKLIDDALKKEKFVMCENVGGSNGVFFMFFAVNM